MIDRCVSMKMSKHAEKMRWYFITWQVTRLINIIFRYSFWRIAAGVAVQLPVSLIPIVAPDTRGQPYPLTHHVDGYTSAPNLWIVTFRCRLPAWAAVYLSRYTPQTQNICHCAKRDFVSVLTFLHSKVDWRSLPGLR